MRGTCPVQSCAHIRVTSQRSPSSPSPRACGSSTASTDDSGSDSQNATAAHVANDTFVSADGNRIGIDFVPPGSDLPSIGTCPKNQIELDVLYLDDTNFFGGAPAIRIFSRTTDQSGTKTSVTETAKQDAGAYSVVHCFDPTAKESTIEVAFSDAAGTKWDSDNGKNYLIDLKASPKPPPADPKGGRDTIVGNHVDFEIVLDPGGNANCARPVLALTYDDKKSFFGNADELSLFWRVNSKTHEAHDFAPLVPGEHPHQFESARLCMDWPADAESLELAITDRAHQKWDSNNGQNYVFTFH
jgi:hypothetical protein